MSVTMQLKINAYPEFLDVHVEDRQCIVDTQNYFAELEHMQDLTGEVWVRNKRRDYSEPGNTLALIIIRCRILKKI